MCISDAALFLFSLSGTLLWLPGERRGGERLEHTLPYDSQPFLEYDMNDINYTSFVPLGFFLMSCFNFMPFAIMEFQPYEIYFKIISWI